MKQNDEHNLSRQDYEHVQKRLTEFDASISMPASLRPENLRAKIPPQEVRRFEEIGRPNFAVWKHYGSLVATMIVLLVMVVMFVNRDVWLGGQLESATGEMAQDTAPTEMQEEGVTSESAPAETSSRSRLYADDYEEVAIALGQLQASTDTGQTSLNSTTSTTLTAGDAVLSQMAVVSTDSGYGGLQSGNARADIVTTDGTHLFYYTAQSHLQDSGVVHIVTADGLQPISTIDVGTSSQTLLHVSGNQLVVISADAQVDTEQMYDQNVTATLEGETTLPTGQTYSVTAVSIYDISDITAPSLVRSFWQDGDYIDCRVSDGELYLLTQKHLYYQDAVRFDPQLHHIAPVMHDSVMGQSYAMSAEFIAIAPDCIRQTYTVLTRIDTDNLQTPANSHAVLGGGEVFVADDAIYLYYDVNPTANTSRIGIVKMTLGTELQVAAQTEVDGDLSRPFAISQQGDVIALATVAVEYNTGRVRNNVYMLDGTLRMLGSVEGMVSGESVQSYSFMDDRVYVQTHEDFESVYAMDLSDPYDPAILGWVTLENFSGQAKDIGNNLMLGLGGVEREMSLWMYNMAPLPPEELYRQDLPGNEGYSAALENSDALLWNPGLGVVGLPLISRQTAIGQDDLLYWGYAVYGFETGVGFSWRGIVSHSDELDESYILTNLHSIERGITLGDTLFTFSGSTIQATDLNTMTTVGRLSLV